jgi:hypothetical protein
MKKLWMVLLLGLLPWMSHAIEEPDYQLVRTLSEHVEVRRYAPYTVAEVVLDAAAGDAGRQAFPILAGYIFGRNKGERTMAMTAPVTQSAAPGAPVKMAMTAPVTQTAAGAGIRVQFVLPKGVTLANAPEPLDDRVRLREEPAVTRVVIRYSGTWSAANEAEHLRRLREVVAEAGLTTVGEPVLARYNGPMTPWFLRRNELWLALEP